MNFDGSTRTSNSNNFSAGSAGFLPANAENVFIGAGTIILAFYSDGLLPLIYSRFNGWWGGLTARATEVSTGGERPGSLAGTQAA